MSWCEKDQAVPVAFAEKMLEDARQMQPGSFDQVEKIDAGHFPMLSQVEWMVGMLRRAAGEEV